MKTCARGCLSLVSRTTHRTKTEPGVTFKHTFRATDANSQPLFVAAPTKHL